MILVLGTMLVGPGDLVDRDEKSNALAAPQTAYGQHT